MCWTSRGGEGRFVLFGEIKTKALHTMKPGLFKRDCLENGDLCIDGRKNPSIHRHINLPPQHLSGCTLFDPLPVASAADIEIINHRVWNSVRTLVISIPHPEFYDTPRNPLPGPCFRFPPSSLFPLILLVSCDAAIYLILYRLLFLPLLRYSIIPFIPLCNEPREWISRMTFYDHLVGSKHLACPLWFV